MPLPTDNLLSTSSARSPYSPANAGLFGSGLTILFGSGLSGPFGSLAPSSNVDDLSSWLTAPANPPHLCSYVIRWYQTILGNIKITDAQREDGEKKHAGVRAALNRHYLNVASETANSLLIGSWNKDTRVRPLRDVDILFLLPPSVYHHIGPAPAIVNLPCGRRSRKSCARPIVRPRPCAPADITSQDSGRSP